MIMIFSNFQYDSTHNENKSVAAERFIKTLKGEIYEKLTADDGKSYLGYLNKLVENAIILIIVLLVKNLLILVILL